MGARVGRVADHVVGEHVGLGNLDGGSDHVGFYTHAGVPSGSLSSGNPGGVYHTNYDNFAWYERFGDSTFAHGPTNRPERALLRGHAHRVRDGAGPHDPAPSRRGA